MGHGVSVNAGAAVSIPVSTHRVRVERPADRSALDPEDPGPDTPGTLVAEHVRAVISAPGGKGAGVAGPVGDSELLDFILVADPCDVNYQDTVTDEATGDRYAVLWALASPGVAGLASVRAGLTTYKGPNQEG